MNIWFVQPNAGGPGLGRQWRTYWLAHYWQRQGHQVTVVTAGFHHLMEGPARPEGLQVIQGVRFWFAQVPTYHGNGLGRVRSMLALGWRLRRTAGRIAREAGRPDVVIASSPHIFAVGACMAVADRLASRFWLEVRDVWPQTLVALGEAHPLNPLVLWAAWVERRAYRKAERVISALAAAEPHMLARGLRPGRFVWAPNGVSDEEIANALHGSSGHALHPVVQRAEQLRRAGCFVLVYAGAMGPAQQLEQLLDALALVPPHQARVHLLIVGKGVRRDALLARRRELALSNVDIEGEIPKAAVRELLRRCDAAVLSLQPNELWRHGLSPNKLFEYCLYAPRVVATCEAAALTGLEDLPIICSRPGDPQALAELLVQLARNPNAATTTEEALKALQRFRLREVAEKILSGADGKPRAVPTSG